MAKKADDKNKYVLEQLLRKRKKPDSEWLPGSKLEKLFDDSRDGLTPTAFKVRVHRFRKYLKKHDKYRVTLQSVTCYRLRGEYE